MKPRIGITSTPALHLERRVDRVSRWYVDAVVAAGGLPLILPTLDPGEAAEVLSGLDGLLLTGGGDVSPALYGEDPVPEVYDVDAARDEWELALIRSASDGVGSAAGSGGLVPVLGVCRGAQLLNVAAGGTLIQHLPEVGAAEPHRQRQRDQEAVHDIEIDPDSRLAQVLGTRRLGVNSIHHQAVGRVGEGFRPVAWAADGVVEAIERTDGAPVVAVQWHPEPLAGTAPHGEIFLWLTRTAAGGRPRLHVDAGLARRVDDVA